MPLIDNLSGSTVQTSFDIFLAHEGRVFIASYKSPDDAPIADNGQIDLLIECGKESARLEFFVGGSGDVETVFYEDTVTANNGTQLSVVSVNRIRSHSPTTQVWYNPEITTIGNQLLNTFESWSTSPAKPFPGLVFPLRPNTKYLIRAINRNGGNQSMSILVKWHELFS